MASVSNGILTLDPGEGSVSGGVLTLAAGVGSVSGGVLRIAAGLDAPGNLRLTRSERRGVWLDATFAWDAVLGATYEMQIYSVRRAGSISAADLMGLVASTIESGTDTMVSRRAFAINSNRFSPIKTVVRVRAVRGGRRSAWTSPIQAVSGR